MDGRDALHVWILARAYVFYYASCYVVLANKTPCSR